MGLQYWVCQECKQGQTNDEKPTMCLNCGKVGGEWKSTDVTNMDSFKTYMCTNCYMSVEEPRTPTYPCICGANSWEIYKPL